MILSLAGGVWSWTRKLPICFLILLLLLKGASTPPFLRKRERLGPECGDLDRCTQAPSVLNAWKAASVRGLARNGFLPSCFNFNLY